VASPVFKTGVTRLRRVRWVRFPHSPATALLLVLLGGAVYSGPASAQSTDSTRAGIQRPPQRSPFLVDSALRPPLTPRRAFLLSLLLPGYSQVRLDRPNAAALFGSAEIFSMAMARKAALDLREAKRGARDSVVLTWKTDPTTGALVRDSVGRPVPATFEHNRYNADLIHARRTHYEDWVAALVFNHLISGADAFVAANLWDFPLNVGGGVSQRRAMVRAKIEW
jgi:hypothetical protein